LSNSSGTRGRIVNGRPLTSPPRLRKGLGRKEKRGEDRGLAKQCEEKERTRATHGLGVEKADGGGETGGEGHKKFVPKNILLEKNTTGRRVGEGMETKGGKEEPSRPSKETAWGVGRGGGKGSTSWKRKRNLRTLLRVNRMGAPQQKRIRLKKKKAKW